MGNHLRHCASGTQMLTRRPVLILLALAVLAACTSPAASPGASPSPSPSTTPTSTPSGPPAADVAVVRIEQTGGMLPIWDTLRWYPFVAMYGDGRLITQGPQIEIYPGPALPNLVVTQLSERGVNQVLDWAVEAGLAGPDRQLGEPLLDSGVTLFTITSSDGTHRTSVWDMAGSDSDTAAVRQFQEVLTNVRAHLPDDIAGDDAPYEYDRMRILSFPVDPEAPPEPNLVSFMDWPLDTPIAEIGTSLGEPAEYRCAQVEGDDLDTLKPSLVEANELTLWRSDDLVYQLYLHPLLPDDEPCPGF